MINKLFVIILGLFIVPASGLAQSLEMWPGEFPKTDFSKAGVNLAEIRPGGPARDGIPPIDNPQFIAVADDNDLADTEPVIGVEINGDARAYPFRILIWHEIANDVVGGVPITVTYCPLCNTAIVFKSQLDGRVLDFGTTGRLRNSDLVMYDRQTESWWQQYTGEAIIGEYTGRKLARIPARIESIGLFKKRHPDGKILVPNDKKMRPYGGSAYAGYDRSARPFLYDGKLPDNIAPMERVVTVEDRAWALTLVRRKQRIETADGLIITWQPGQTSALDKNRISKSRDVGNVLVQRIENGQMADVPYGVDFAFAFHAFHPDGEIIIE